MRRPISLQHPGQTAPARQKSTLPICRLTFASTRSPISQPGLFEHHDRSRFHPTTAISLTADDHSAISQRTRKSFDELIDTERLTDDETIALIKSKEIGHSGRSHRSHRGIADQDPRPSPGADPGELSRLPGQHGPQRRWTTSSLTAFPDPAGAPGLLRRENRFICRIPTRRTIGSARFSERRFSRNELGLPVFWLCVLLFSTIPSRSRHPQFDRWMNILKAGRRQRPMAARSPTKRQGPIFAKRRRSAASIRGRLVFAPRMPLEDHLARQSSGRPVSGYVCRTTRTPRPAMPCGQDCRF